MRSIPDRFLPQKQVGNIYISCVCVCVYPLQERKMCVCVCVFDLCSQMYVNIYIHEYMCIIFTDVYVCHSHYS